MEIGISLLVQTVEVGGLAHHLLALHQQRTGILSSDKSRLQKNLFLIRLTLENVNA